MTPDNCPYHVFYIDEFRIIYMIIFLHTRDTYLIPTLPPRQRGPTVYYEEIERTARDLMAKGERPTVDGVRAALGHGSPNHIATCMQRFWKKQAAISTGNPLALTRLRGFEG